MDSKWNWIGHVDRMDSKKMNLRSDRMRISSSSEETREAEGSIGVTPLSVIQDLEV